jgi:thymidine phosphorylase
MKKIGDRIEEGDTLGFIHANTLEKRNSFVERLKNCYEFTDKYQIKQKPVLGIME